MSEQINEAKMLALALYEIRILLSSYLGSENSGPIEVRTAAHLAYALHNEALAMLEGRSINIQDALDKVRAIDGILNVNVGADFAVSLANFNTKKA